MKQLIRNKLIHHATLRFWVTSAMIVMSLLPGLVLIFIYYGNMSRFYKEKIETYQDNLMAVMSAQITDTLNQSEVVSKQVLGLAVTSAEFDNYYNMNPYEKLLLSRNINSQLKNIRIANDAIDDIYMIGFDGNCYTSNSSWNKESFFRDGKIEINKNQSGKTVTLPTHEASYKYLNPSTLGHQVISQVTYLNKYTRNGVIGLVQIDIDYKKIEEAMSAMKMTEGDFAYITDKDGHVIYAPFDEDLWMGLEDIVSFKRQTGNSIIRECKIKNGLWKIVQVNSQNMLKDELNKLSSAWFSVAALCLISAILLALLLSHSITKPITSLIKNMHKVSDGNFNAKVEKSSNKDLAELADSFNIMVSEVDKLLKENVSKERERMTMELTALSTQINSHFLYNTLNTIKWMAIKIGADDIAKLVVSLVNMLEYSCKNMDKPVYISEEISFIEDYIYIQEVRYKSTVNIHYDLDETLKDCMILKMLLQPIMENAMIHGFIDRSSGNEIRICIRNLGNHIQIQVKDNGKGFAYAGKDRLTGIGLTNIQDRLRLNYGEKYQLNIESKIGTGTIITVEIPFLRGSDKDAENINCR